MRQGDPEHAVGFGEVRALGASFQEGELLSQGQGAGQRSRSARAAVQIPRQTANSERAPARLPDGRLRYELKRVWKDEGTAQQLRGFHLHLQLRHESLGVDVARVAPRATNCENGRGRLQGEGRCRAEPGSVVERQAQLTEWRCLPDWRRVGCESQLGHESPRRGLCPGDLDPSHRAAASRTTFEVRGENMGKQPRPAMTDGFGCTVVHFAQELELVT
jgi:hypothetical protein